MPVATAAYLHKCYIQMFVNPQLPESSSGTQKKHKSTVTPVLMFCRLENFMLVVWRTLCEPPFIHQGSSGHFLTDELWVFSLNWLFKIYNALAYTELY